MLFIPPGEAFPLVFSHSLSFLTHFNHLDVIWGVLKRNRNGHNDQGATETSTSQEQLGRCLESLKKELWCHIQPHHFSAGRPGPPQWKLLSPVCPSSRHRGEGPSVCRRRGVSPSFVWSGSRRPLSPCLPSWDVTPLTARQASTANTRAPPQLFSLTINTGTNLTPFPCLAFVNHHPFFY